jgi:hypothetical protein
MSLNDDNTDAVDDSPFMKPKLELVKPPAVAETVAAEAVEPVEQKLKGLGAPRTLGAAPLPPGLPTNIAADWTILTNLQAYLNLVNTDAAGLLADASVLQNFAKGPTAETADITKAYNTIYTAFGATPAQLATAVQSSINDLVTQANTITAQANTIAQMNADSTKFNADVLTYEATLKSQIASLQAQVASLTSGTAMVPSTPAAPAPATSNTTMFLVGTAAVLGIAGTVWYLSKNRPSRSPMPKRLPSRM